MLKMPPQPATVAARSIHGGGGCGGSAMVSRQRAPQLWRQGRRNLWARMKLFLFFYFLIEETHGPWIAILFFRWAPLLWSGWYGSQLATGPATLEQRDQKTRSFSVTVGLAVSFHQVNFLPPPLIPNSLRADLKVFKRLGFVCPYSYPVVCIWHWKSPENGPAREWVQSTPSVSNIQYMTSCYFLLFSIYYSSSWYICAKHGMKATRLKFFL